MPLKVHAVEVVLVVAIVLVCLLSQWATVGREEALFVRGKRKMMTARCKMLSLLVLLHLFGCATTENMVPMAEVTAAWSSRAGGNVIGGAGVPMANERFAFDIQTKLQVDRLGIAPSESTTATSLEGVAPSSLMGGVAFNYPWKHTHFTGFVFAALDIGVADAQWGGTGGGRFVADLEWVRLFGAFQAVADSRWNTSYNFGFDVRPYIKFVEVGWRCSSEDGSTTALQKPCGPDLALKVTLPSTGVDLRFAFALPFHDLLGHTGEVGERAMLTLTVRR